MSDLVVKSNRLNSVIQNLSLSEIRLVQLAIVNARETGLGITAETPLTIRAVNYAEVFNVRRQVAYEALRQAETKLFKRHFTFLDNQNKKVKSAWLQRVRYLDDEGALEVIFTIDVVNEITRLNGKEQFFTSYLLEQTADMKSNYSVRLYELLIQWKAVKNSPLFELEEFRKQLGLECNEYKAMCDFKKRVLDVAKKEINEKSDIKVSYKQKKKGRKIAGFTFTIIEKQKPKSIEEDDSKNAPNDNNTPDLFLDLTDKEQQTTRQKADEYIAKSHIKDPNHIANIYQKALTEKWGVEAYRIDQSEEKKRWQKDKEQREQEKSLRENLSEEERAERQRQIQKMLGKEK